MKRVLVSQVALQDLKRLEAWLLERSPAAAVRIGPLLDFAIGSLGEHSDRGRAGPRPNLRELVVPFGAGAYIIQYRVGIETVIVARVKHSRERR